MLLYLGMGLRWSSSAEQKPKDYYVILGILPSSTETEIKNAYRELGRENASSTDIM